MTAYTIEHANWRDVGALQQLERECFGNDSYPLLGIMETLILPGIVRYKATLSDRMIGFIAGERDSHEAFGWITTVAVRENFRRQGIGRALINICESDLGYKRIRLCVKVSNIAAIKLYESLGYRYFSTWNNYYTDDEDALVLEKQM